MSSLDFDFDSQFASLERDWRQAYEDSLAARAAYQALAARRGARAGLLDRAQERLDRTEEKKARIMAKIERLESTIMDR